MTENRIQLIGLDLDGTTLTTDKKLTDHTRNVLEECLRRGIHVLPATGRAANGIPDALKEIEGLRYVITSNGANIIDLYENKIIYENGIPWDYALEIFDMIEPFGTYYDAYIEGCGWCEGRFYDRIEDFNIEKPIMDFVKISRKRIEDLRAFVREKQKPIEKINMFFADQKDRDCVFEKIAKLPGIVPTYSLKNNIEINHGTCNKGDALLNLGRILQIPRENIMACGDGGNDLEMIKQAGVGVAMANAMDLLKRNADYITKSNDEDGVACAIEKYCNL